MLNDGDSLYIVLRRDVKTGALDVLSDDSGWNEYREDAPFIGFAYWYDALKAMLEYARVECGNVEPGKEKYHYETCEIIIVNDYESVPEP